MDASDSLRSYASEKVEKVADKYLKNAVEAHVILSAHKNRHIHGAEINIHASRFVISAHADLDDMYAAIDTAVDKVEAQLRKHKDRINASKRGTGSPEAATMIPVDVLSSHDEEGGPRVIETASLPAKPLSVEDAVLQLDLHHSEFLVFRNASTNAISVVYRRRDGNYGLIVPNV